MDVELARQQWEDGNRRVEAARSDLARYRELTARVDLLVAGLRKRVGQTFTLEDLAAAYVAADRWAAEAVEERAGTPGWPRHLADVQGAAFHVYQRGAVDYTP